jgi:predicted transcriptional regulator
MPLQAQKSKLTPAQRLVLCALRERSPLNIGELSEFTGSSPYSVQKMTHYMYTRGFIVREKIEGCNTFSLPTSPSQTAPAPSIASPDSSAVSS